MKSEFKLENKQPESTINRKVLKLGKSCLSRRSGGNNKPIGFGRRVSRLQLENPKTFQAAQLARKNSLEQ